MLNSWIKKLTDATSVKTIRDELRKFAGFNGSILCLDDILNSAKEESSPLHAFFEWDDAKAAMEYRREQVKLLIKSMTSMPKKENEK